MNNPVIIRAGEYTCKTRIYTTALSTALNGGKLILTIMQGTLKILQSPLHDERKAVV